MSACTLIISAVFTYYHGFSPCSTGPHHERFSI